MHRSTIAAFAAATLLVACSGNDAAKTDASKVAQSGSAAATSMYDPATRTATIHAKEFGYTASDSIPAGYTTFRLVNDGTTLHHAQIARLEGGKTMADLGAAMKKPTDPLPAWVILVGGPNAPNPGAESNATLNLQPGNYVMLCFVDTPDHVPHVAKGMIRPFTVTASTAAGTEPATDVSVELSDYNFAVAGNLTPGHHVIKVTNKATQGHEVEILKLVAGKTLKDVAAWGEKFEGPMPADAVGGVAGLAQGASGSFGVDFTPGNYVLICFYPDAKDGKPHMEHGMVKEFKVN